MALEKKDLNIKRIHDFEKNTLRVGIDKIFVEIKGEQKPYCGVRELYKSDDGQWLPSNKGVTFPAENVQSLISAIDQAIEIDPYPTEGIELSIIPKNSTEQIKVSATKYKDHEYVDLRSYFKKDGEYHPTKKGVTIPPDCLEDLKEGLEKFLADN